MPTEAEKVCLSGGSEVIGAWSSDVHDLSGSAKRKRPRALLRVRWRPRQRQEGAGHAIFTGKINIATKLLPLLRRRCGLHGNWWMAYAPRSICRGTRPCQFVQG